MKKTNLSKIKLSKIKLLIDLVMLLVIFMLCYVNRTIGADGGISELVIVCSLFIGFAYSLLIDKDN